MKNMNLRFIAVCLAVGGISASAAEEVQVSGDVGLTYASAYMWRGKDISDRSMLQPELVLRADKWTLDAWGTWDVNVPDDENERTRADLSVDYAFAVKQLQMKAGIAMRAYKSDTPEDLKDTYEVYAQAAASELMLCPSLTVYCGFGEVSGVYAQAAAGETVTLCNWADLLANLSLGFATAGFNKDFFGMELPDEDAETGEAAVVDTGKAGLVDLVGSVAVPMTYKDFIITPKIQYSMLVNSTLRDAVEATDGDTDRLAGTVTVTWTF